MQEEFIKQMLGNPLFWGVVQKFVVDAIKKVLANIDSQHLTDNYTKYLQVGLVVVTALASLLTAALGGKAADFDPTNLVQYFVTVYLTSQGTHATLSNADSAIKASPHLGPVGKYPFQK